MTIKVDVQADFWDGYLDIDAVCRMEHAPECKFDPTCFPIAGNSLLPSIPKTRFFRAKF